MVLHTRRSLLGSLTAGVSLLAGCGGDVRTRPDRFSVTPTGTTRPENHEPTLDAADLQQRVDIPRRGSFVRAYDQRGLHILVDPDGPVLQSTDDDELDLQVQARGYPNPEPGDVYAEMQVVVKPSSDGRTGVTVQTDLTDAPPHRAIYYHVALRTGGGDEDDIVHLHETDPFLVGEESITPVRSAADERLFDSDGDAETSNAETSDDDTVGGSSPQRTSAEGAIRVDYPVGDDRIVLDVPKSAYLRAEHYAFEALNRHELVAASVEDGVVPRFARSIVGQTMADGVASSPRELVDRAIDVVQGLPNGPKSVTSTYDSDRKSLARTVVDLGGDSEDRSLLLGGLLQSPQLGLDAVLVDVEGHAAVGVQLDGATGYSYELGGQTYAHIETTELGWDIGEAPEAHRGMGLDWYNI